MKQQSRHDRMIVSCVFAPLALITDDGASQLPTLAFDTTSHGVLLLTTLTTLFCVFCLGGVLTRFTKSLTPRVNGNAACRNGGSALACAANEKLRKPVLPGSDERAKLVQRFLDQGRIAILLRPQIARTLESEHFKIIEQVFHHESAFIFAGETLLTDWTVEETELSPSQVSKRRVEVDAFYLDRCTITNRQFKEFVDDGGYAQQSVWDAAIWTRIAEFVDHSGLPGPRFWNSGEYPPAEHELPVIGVNWYEADAYARWCGRRLPTDAEWVKAAVCPNASTGPDLMARKFPWGDTFDPQRANVWISGNGALLPAARTTTDSTEIVHLIGNVWEWTACDAKVSSYGRDVQFDVPLKSLRGGAFDTYFENQATCQLQSGDSPLARRRNVGFRCALSASELLEFGGPA
jgi:iron(II)-dependent oxidoreductase